MGSLAGSWGMPRAHGKSSARAKRRRTRVPSPGSDRTSRSPPNSVARSPIVESPSPSCGVPGTKPLPSSATSATNSSSDAPRVTHTCRAAECWRALVSASRTSRSSWVATPFGKSVGKPSSTTSLTSRSGVRSR